MRGLWASIALLLAATQAAAADYKEGDRFLKELSEDMEFRSVTNGGNCDSCEWIAGEGKITQDTPRAFRDFMAAEMSDGGYAHSLVLNSAGGNAFAGIQLGEEVRRLNMNTSVGTSPGILKGGYVWMDDFAPSRDAICASACVFAFAGGVQRYAANLGYGKPSRIGVHQFYDPKVFDGPEAAVFNGIERSSDQVLVGIILEYLTRMGVTSDLWAIASKVAPWEEMHWLSAEELLETQLDNTSRSPAAELIGYRNGVTNVVVEFSRDEADYRVELYCDAQRRIHLLAKIRWREEFGPEEQEAFMAWNPYSSLQTEDGVRLTREAIEFSDTEGGGTEIKVRMRFEGVLIEDFVSRTSFKFDDDASRYATTNAAKLSFTLPTNFDGMHVLPRTCLRK